MEKLKEILAQFLLSIILIALIIAIIYLGLFDRIFPYDRAGLMTSFTSAVIFLTIFYSLTTNFRLGWTILNLLLNTLFFIVEMGVLGILQVKDGTFIATAFLVILGLSLWVANKFFIDYLLISKVHVKTRDSVLSKWMNRVI